MKTRLLKTITLAVSTFLYANAASAALLESEYVSGIKKVCIYSDGSTITKSSASICPLTN